MKTEMVKTTTRSSRWTRRVYWENSGRTATARNCQEGHHSQVGRRRVGLRMLAFMTCYVGFFWLCLWDNQCIVHGSTIGTRTTPRFWRSRTPPEVCSGCYGCGLSSCLRHRRTDSAREYPCLAGRGRSGAKKEPAALVLRPQISMAGRRTALITSLVLIAAASERSTKIRHQYKSVTRNWERCEREAAANGVWIEHGSCPWDNSVRLFYKPEEGDEVEARGRPATIYRDRGDSYDVDYLDGELEREEHLKRSDVLWNEAGTIRRKRRTFLEHRSSSPRRAACLMAAPLPQASYSAGAGGAGAPPACRRSGA